MTIEDADVIRKCTQYKIKLFPSTPELNGNADNPSLIDLTSNDPLTPGNQGKGSLKSCGCQISGIYILKAYGFWNEALLKRMRRDLVKGAKNKDDTREATGAVQCVEQSCMFERIQEQSRKQ